MDDKEENVWDGGREKRAAQDKIRGQQPRERSAHKTNKDVERMIS